MVENGTKRPFRQVARAVAFRGNNRHRAATLNQSILTRCGHEWAHLPVARSGKVITSIGPISFP